MIEILEKFKFNIQMRGYKYNDTMEKKYMELLLSEETKNNYYLTIMKKYNLKSTKEVINMILLNVYMNPNYLSKIHGPKELYENLNEIVTKL